MDAQLRLGDDLAEFLPTSVSTRQEDEIVSETGHERFALVHGFDYAELRQAGVGDFLFEQIARNHSEGLSTRRQDRIGEYTHEADSSSAKNERDAETGQERAELHRDVFVDWPFTRTRSTEDSPF